MFVDSATIQVVAGAGGNGCVSFRREKYVPRGGPDGGDGGNGGCVYLICSARVHTLIAFRFRRLYKGERGRHGQGSNKTGRTGNDLFIEIPAGTLVLSEHGEVLGDLKKDGERLLLAKGGRGGRGNARFTSSTNQAPRYAEPGKPGEELTARLELKLLADVGLVGLPNAGKSTLLARISSAQPKVASYPFTTLSPHLGVVDVGDYRSVVLADIPGLIEGAHLGTGLGIQFLKHIERTRVLFHLVDISEGAQDPVGSLETVESELAAFGSGLTDKPRVVIATKLDASGEKRELKKLAAHCRNIGLEMMSISAVTGEGIQELIRMIGDLPLADDEVGNPSDLSESAEQLEPGGP